MSSLRSPMLITLNRSAIVLSSGRWCVRRYIGFDVTLIRNIHHGLSLGGTRVMRVVLMIMTASVCIAGELPVAEAQSAANSARQVSLSGSALHDDDGSLLGLGATYMQALRRAKFDRPRLHSDLSFLAQNGFNYVRILSMVG